MLTVQRFRSLFVVSIVLQAFVIAGCMISPTPSSIFKDEQLKWHEPIPFSGCAIAPNAQITIQAKPAAISDPSQIVVLGTLTSSAQVTFTDSRLMNWYCWSGSFQVPRRLWSPSRDRPGISIMTQVRSIDSSLGGPTHTYTGNCGADPGLAAMEAGCTVPPTSGGGWVLRIAPSALDP